MLNSVKQPVTQPLNSVEQQAPQLSNTVERRSTPVRLPQSEGEESEGLSQKDALKAAGYPGNVANAARDLAGMNTTPQEWLVEHGWEQKSRRWYRG